MRDGRVWQRALGRLEPVDVILRRVDAAWCDPLDLRQDSRLGVPGLLEAARLGTVAVVNGIGSGVIENPGLLPFLPALADALLDEPLILPAAPTWWCGEPTARSHVLARLPELLIKPIARGLGRGTVVGAELSTAERARAGRPDRGRAARLGRPAAAPAQHRAGDHRRRSAGPAAGGAARVRGGPRRPVRGAGRGAGLGGRPGPVATRPARERGGQGRVGARPAARRRPVRAAGSRAGGPAGRGRAAAAGGAAGRAQPPGGRRHVLARPLRGAGRGHGPAAARGHRPVGGLPELPRTGRPVRAGDAAAGHHRR